MNPDDIQLDSMGKSFEYEKIAREIEKMDRDQAISCAKSYLKLYFKQQEVVKSIANM